MSTLHNCPDCGGPCDCNGAETPTWFCDHCLVVDEPTYAQRLEWHGSESGTSIATSQNPARSERPDDENKALE